MKKFIYTIFSTFLILTFHSYADDSFSVEIEALTLVMAEYNDTSSKTKDLNDQSPSYMAFKQDECNAKVEVTEKNGLQIQTKQLFDVNVCKKEINKLIK